MARPSEYSEQTAAEICELMIQGKGLQAICQRDDMPARTTVYRWLEGRDAFRNRYARAREALMDFYAEQILTIAFDESGDIVLDQDGDKTKVVANHAKVQRDRLKVDSLKWIASRLFPKRYGDSPETDEPAGLERVTKIERVIIGNPERTEDPRPPQQLTYQPPQPGELNPEQWATLRRLLDLIDRAVGERPADEVFEVLRTALLDHFRDA